MTCSRALEPMAARGGMLNRESSESLLERVPRSGGSLTWASSANMTKQRLPIL